MRSSYRVASGVAAPLVVVSLLVPCVGAGAVGPQGLRCQRAVASGRAALLARELSELGRCVGVVAACVQTRPRDAACLADARSRCERAVARTARRVDALGAKIAARCAAVPPDALLGADGLGFAALAPVCPALGTAQADVAVLGACLADAVRCSGERLLATAVPRAGELVRVAGIAAGARGVLGCLVDHGGSGGGVRDADAGTAVVRCVRTLARASARVTLRTLGNVGACARDLRACGELAGGGDACIADARATCATAFARVASAEATLRDAVVARCGPSQLDFATVADGRGAGFDALADPCAAVGVDEVATASDVAECLGRRHACDAIALVRDGTPRVDALLALVDVDLARAYCRPAPPTRTPPPAATPTPTASATPTVMGPTRTARPGETATPTPHATPTRTTTPLPGPTATPVCGNGELEDGEECDGRDFGGDTCEDLCFESAPEGELDCTSDCTIDFLGCSGVDCESP